MNFHPTHIAQSAGTLRKDSRRQLAPLALRCDRHAESSSPLSPCPLRDFYRDEVLLNHV